MKNLRVLCKHYDGWSWIVVVRELIDAMILDKSQFAGEGRTYTVVGETDAEPHVSSILTSKIVKQKFKDAIDGNYAEEAT